MLRKAGLEPKTTGGFPSQWVIQATWRIPSGKHRRRQDALRAGTVCACPVLSVMCSRVLHRVNVCLLLRVMVKMLAALGV